MKTLFCLLISILSYSQDFKINNDSINLENGSKAHFEENNFEKAELIYNQILQNDYKNSDAYFRRGRLYFSWKKYKNAIKDFEKSIEYNYSDLSKPYSMIGMSKMLLNNNPKSLCKDFKKAIKYDKTLNQNNFYKSFCK